MLKTLEYHNLSELTLLHKRGPLSHNQLMDAYMGHIPKNKDSSSAAPGGDRDVSNNAEMGIRTSPAMPEVF